MINDNKIPSTRKGSFICELNVLVFCRLEIIRFRNIKEGQKTHCPKQITNKKKYIS